MFLVYWYQTNQFNTMRTLIIEEDLKTIERILEIGTNSESEFIHYKQPSMFSELWTLFDLFEWVRSRSDGLSEAFDQHSTDLVFHIKVSEKFVVYSIDSQKIKQLRYGLLSKSIAMYEDQFKSFLPIIGNSVLSTGVSRRQHFSKAKRNMIKQFIDLSIQFCKTIRDLFFQETSYTQRQIHFN